MSERYSYQEPVRSGAEEDLEELRQRAIRSLYNEAVRNGRYPISKPKVKLVNGSPFTVDGGYTVVRAEVDCIR